MAKKGLKSFVYCLKKLYLLKEVQKHAHKSKITIDVNKSKWIKSQYLHQTRMHMFCMVAWAPLCSKLNGWPILWGIPLKISQWSNLLQLAICFCILINKSFWGNAQSFCTFFLPCCNLEIKISSIRRRHAWSITSTEAKFQRSMFFFSKRLPLTTIL